MTTVNYMKACGRSVDSRREEVKTAEVISVQDSLVTDIANWTAEARKGFEDGDEPTLTESFHRLAETIKQNMHCAVLIFDYSFGMMLLESVERMQTEAGVLSVLRLIANISSGYCDACEFFDKGNTMGIAWHYAKISKGRLQMVSLRLMKMMLKFHCERTEIPWSVSDICTLESHLFDDRPPPELVLEFGDLYKAIIIYRDFERDLDRISYAFCDMCLKYRNSRLLKTVADAMRLVMECNGRFFMSLYNAQLINIFTRRILEIKDIDTEAGFIEPYIGMLEHSLRICDKSIRVAEKVEKLGYSTVMRMTVSTNDRLALSSMLLVHEILELECEMNTYGGRESMQSVIGDSHIVRQWMNNFDTFQFGRKVVIGKIVAKLMKLGDNICYTAIMECDYLRMLACLASETTDKSIIKMLLTTLHRMQEQADKMHEQNEFVEAIHTNDVPDFVYALVDESDPEIASYVSYFNKWMKCYKNRDRGSQHTMNQ